MIQHISGPQILTTDKFWAIAATGLGLVALYSAYRQVANAVRPPMCALWPCVCTHIHAFQSYGAEVLLCIFA
jgi:hypothetical protein